MSNTPTDRDREYLQAELTRMVGIGRINLGVFQHAVDAVLAAEDTSILADIHARYIGPPPAEWGPLPHAPQSSQGTPAQAPPAQPPQQPHPQAPQYPQGPQSPTPPQYQMPHQGQPQQQQPHLPAPQPQVPQPMNPGYPMPAGAQYPGVQQAQHEFSSTMGTIKRSGQWVVPEHCLFKLNAASLNLDLREAIAAAQVITFELRATAAEIKITVPPGVHVLNHLRETWTDSKINVTAPAPNAPQIILSGHVRGCTLVVETRPTGQKSLWQQFWG